MKTLDLRKIPPKDRHSMVFNTFDNLKTGDVLVLKTDHDPRPLFYQFAAERKGDFNWENKCAGPEVWEVAITRMAQTPSVASIARQFPAAPEVFNRLKIDYCCHGNESFSAAAHRIGYTPAELMEEIKNAPAPSIRMNYDRWSLGMLCDFIVMNHHSYVREALPELLELVSKVNIAHGAEHEYLADLAKTIRYLSDELGEHMKKEEEELFPLVKRVESEGFHNSKDMEELLYSLKVEHERAGSLIQQIREITKDYTLPEDACYSFESLYKRLSDFEVDLYMHVHLENNVLFEKLSTQFHDNSFSL